MYCTTCGAGSPLSAAVCSACGTQLRAAATERPAPTAQQPSPADLAYPLLVEQLPPAVPAQQPPHPAVQALPQPPPAAQLRVSPALRRHRAIAVAAVVVLGGLAVAGWQVHWPPALFGSAGPPPPLAWRATQAPLPSDAAISGIQFSELDDVACASAASCVAVGAYTIGIGSNSLQAGLIETLSGGGWAAARAPFTVPGTTGDATVALGGIACPSPVACVAVGYYNENQRTEPLIETLSGSAWVSASPPLPGGAGQSQDGAISRVACPAPGTCVATGWYIDRNGDTQAMIDTLSGGTWTAARAPLPADATPRPTAQESVLTTVLFSVSCPAPGTCVATGWYTDRNGGVRGLIDTLSGGTWTAARAPLPGDAAAPRHDEYLFALACQAPGSCLAAGGYNSRNGQSRNLLATLSGGTWTPAAVPLPADAASQKSGLDQGTGLFSVACQAMGTCEAAGSYIARDGALAGVIDTLSGGTWTAVQAPLPANAAKANPLFVVFESAACPSPRACFIVGGYKAADGSTESLIETATPKNQFAGSDGPPRTPVGAATFATRRYS